MNSTTSAWRWFFALAALQAGAAFVASIAAQHGSGLLSVGRFGILALLAAFLFLAAFLAIRPPQRLVRPSHASLSIPAFTGAVLLAVLLFLLRYLQPERLMPYYERLSPLLWFLIVLPVEFSAFTLWLRSGFDISAIRQLSAWRSAALAFALLLLVFLFVAVTRIGLIPDSAYWGEPGVPVLGWQFALALLGGAAVFALRLKSRRAVWLIPAIIWLVAVLIWLSVPMDVMKNSFYAPMDPPANQPFPNSDAGYYDSMAESLRIGYPYQGDIPTRPFYIVFLALLHLIVGERFDLLLAGQAMLLALIPVTLYLLGKRLHSRAAGLIAALFAIFRELNSLLISSHTRVSNTRTLLVDLPTLLLLLVACLFIVRWLQRRDRRAALIAGGLMGLLLLLRTQTLLLPPILLVLVLVAYGWRQPAWRLPVLLFVLGLIAAAAPWLLHNYLESGHFTLDAPFQYQVIASQYKYTGNLDLGAIDLNGKSLFGIVLAFALKDPKFVLGFIVTHFFATMIDSLLVLPLIARYDGLLAPLNLYWIDWAANLTALNIAIMIGYLAVIAVGLGAAWKRLRWAGLVPLAFSLAYALTNGIGRFSGWRYDLPADWVAYFYFALGAAELILLLNLAFRGPASLPGAGEAYLVETSTPPSLRGEGEAYFAETSPKQSRSGRDQSEPSSPLSLRGEGEAYFAETSTKQSRSGRDQSEPSSPLSLRGEGEAHLAETSTKQSRSASGQPLTLRAAALYLAAFLLIGALPWIASVIAAPRYANETLPILIQRLGSSAAVKALNIDRAQLESFASDPQATLQIGRVLYPRFFTRGQGLASAHPWPSYAPRDFPRLGFILLNQSRHEALIPMRQQPSEFPHAADAIILGCLRDDYIEVRLILFPSTDTAYLSTPLTAPCD